MERISADDTTFGVGYRERTKKIGAHFKDEFQRLRNEIEDETYFHQLILEDYRYKGDSLYSNVKKDLQSNKSVYKVLLEHIPKKTHIVHLSNSQGQFDFLLLLDSNDRKITTYIEDLNVRTIVKSSYITNNYNNLHFVGSIEKALAERAEVLVIGLNSNQSSVWNSEISNEILILIVLNTNKDVCPKNMSVPGFNIVTQNNNFIVLNRGKVTQA